MAIEGGGGFVQAALPAASSADAAHTLRCMVGSAQVTVWPVLHYDDTEAALRFLVDVPGFREALVARDDVDAIVHAELRWPAGGAILFGSTKHLDSVHGGIPRGASAMYIPTDEIDPIHLRAKAAGADIIQSPDHDQIWIGRQCLRIHSS